MFYVAVFILFSGLPKTEIINGKTPETRQKEVITHNVSTGNLILGGVASIIPGIIISGGGHYMTGDNTGAKKLFYAKATGLGILISGFLPILFSNASEKVMFVAYPVALTGFGLFSISTLADLFGTLNTGAKNSFSNKTPYTIQLEQNIMHVHDPQFNYDFFSYSSVFFNFRKTVSGIEGYYAPEDSNKKLKLSTSYILLGKAPSEFRNDNSKLEITVAWSWHKFPNELFSTQTYEISCGGRMELHHFHGSLKGSFSEISLGAALERVKYDFTPTDKDYSSLLLFRFSFGIYLGSNKNGELEIFYNHRHDDWAAGLGAGGMGDGVLGHFGIQGHYFFNKLLGVRALFEAGMAYRTVLGMVIRY
ncbi:MAG: hypothetical protein JXR95_01425 [Deltaproteobacteria bacterium]|nr:hypothetical protein [Deltaproteobacteria bacterium]